MNSRGHLIHFPSNVIGCSFSSSNYDDEPIELAEVLGYQASDETDGYGTDFRSGSRGELIPFGGEILQFIGELSRQGDRA